MQAGFVPALRFHALTRFYDPLIRVGMRDTRFKRRLVQQVGLRPGMRVLDLGCGTGTLTVLLKESCPDAEVTGLDADPAILALAQRKARDAGVTIDFREGSATDPPFPPGSFDRVVSSLVFHHLNGEDKARALDRTRSLLRSGGEIHIADWGRPHGPVMRAAFLAVQVLDGFDSTAEHTRGRLVERLSEAGFSAAEESHRQRTLFGTLSFYRAVV